jgi:cyclophilin family peptidyl-prolyl cis-trans isomerase
MKRLLFLALATTLLGTTHVLAQEKNPMLLMETSLGDIKIELYADKAPITVKNILGYVDDKFYDGLVFHRVIPNFMIQGGGFEQGLKEKKTRDPIKNESTNGLENKRGTLAMARTSDPDSATAQFFINLKDNAFLDRAKAQDGVGYCVFGKVTDGMDVVDKIAKARRGNKIAQTRGGPANFSDVPEEEIVIKSVRKLEPK